MLLYSFSSLIFPKHGNFIVQDEKMREQCLKLTLACLSYDFFGTSSDETTEDVGTVQVCVCVCMCVRACVLGGG